MAETAYPRLPEEDEDFDSSRFDFGRFGIFSVDADFNDVVDPFADFSIAAAPDPVLQREDKLGFDLNDPVVVEEEFVVDSGLGIDIFGDDGNDDDVVGTDSSVVDDDLMDDIFLGVRDGNGDVDFDFGWLGLGLGFDRVERGRGVRVRDSDQDDHDDHDGDDDVRTIGVMIGESAAAAARCGDGSGVGVVEIESESDVERDGELGVVSGCGDCGECRRLEGEREEVNEDLEWERVEEERMELRRELHRSLMIASDVASLVSIESYETDEAMRNVGDSFESNEAMRSLDEAMRNMEWEVAGHGSDEEDDGDYVYNEDYDLVFGQFTDGESLRRVNPPAAKSVVDELPSMDKHNGDAFCAICKDEILSKETTKQLPCSHYYHGECIVPWLGIRNTCPVCRFELPTDDPEYERRRIEEDNIDVAMAAFEASITGGLRYGVFVEPL